RHGHPSGCRRPPDGYCPRREHPAHVRNRLLRRVGARGLGGRNRRFVRESRPRGRRELAPVFACRRDHRRNGLARRRRRGRASAGPRVDLRCRLSARDLHVLLDDLHVRPTRGRPRVPATRTLRKTGMKRTSVGHALERGIGVAVLVFALAAPALVSTPFMSTYFVNFILTQPLFLGTAAASLIFLSAYGGMVSLAQVSIFGI